MPLSNDQIQGLLAKRRVKGLYEEKMNFLITESDEPGVDVKEDWPVEFGEKSATTLYQGFRNAAEKLEVDDQVDILQRDGTVFILVKSRVALALGNTTANGNHEDAEDEVEATVVATPAQ